MAQNCEGIVKYSRNWLQGLIEETVNTRDFTEKVMRAARGLTSLYESGKEFDIVSTLAPLRYQAPQAAYHRDAVKLIVSNIDWVCRTNQPENLYAVLERTSSIRFDMEKIEYMFSTEVLEELPAWQALLP